MISAQPAGSWGRFSRITLLRSLFFLSGISGLIYQVVWMRALTRILGCTVYASSTVLASFMAGLALGSFMAARWVDRARSPVRVYGLLEIAIAGCGLLLPVAFHAVLPLFQLLHAALGGDASGFVFMRAAIVFTLLLVPTALMGATLPALAAGVSRTLPQFDRQISWLYGLNTLGAMTGSLVSGLVLIGMFGETVTVAVAAFINTLVGVIAVARRGDLEDTEFPSAARVESSGEDRRIASSTARSNVLRMLVLASFAVTGMVSLGFEVIWSRQLVLFTGTSIYAFSTMLVFFLGGLGLGSLLGGEGKDGDGESLVILSLQQTLLGSIGIVGQCWITQLPPANPFETQGMLNSFAPLVMIFVFALISGMMFPRIVRVFSFRCGSGGKSLGQLYAANTVGCIVGALVTGFWLIPAFGTSRAAVGLALLNILFGLLLWAGSFRGVSWRLRGLVPAAVACTAVLIPLARHSYDTILLRIATEVWGEDLEIYYHREGAVAATTALGSKSDPMMSTLWVNGVGMTHLGTVTKLMAHLPLMTHGKAEKMLVICFGMGTTLRSAATYPGLSVTSVELVPDVYECFGCFHPDGPELWRRPNIRKVVDDGRNFLLMHHEKFDVITIDPPPPVHSAGTVNLYTRNFFELCHQRLRPGGMVCMWIPPVARSELVVIMSSFGSAFPHTTLWTAPDTRGFYCLGQTDPRPLDPDTVAAYLGRPAIRQDLSEYGYSAGSAADFEKLRLLDESAFRQFVQPYPAMTDDRPYTEFPLWRRLLRPERWKLYRSDDLIRELGLDSQAANSSTASTSPQACLGGRYAGP